MYYCCTRSEGLIYQGRGKNKKVVKFRGLGDTSKFAREYSIKNQKVCEVFESDIEQWNPEKNRKTVAYKKGELIYFNRG